MMLCSEVTRIVAHLCGRDVMVGCACAGHSCVSYVCRQGGRVCWQQTGSDSWEGVVSPASAVRGVVVFACSKRGGQMGRYCCGCVVPMVAGQNLDVLTFVGDLSECKQRWAHFIAWDGISAAW